MLEFEINPWEFFKLNDIKSLRRKYHPDVLKDNGEMFIKLQAAYERSQNPLTYEGKYPLYSEVTQGDLRKVYLTEGGLIKVPTIRNKQIENLITKEITTINKLREEKILCGYIPAIVDTAGFSIVVNESGMTLSYIMTRLPDLNDKHIVWMLNRCLECLTFVHENGYCHNAINRNHVIFNPTNHAGNICGWIHSKPTGSKIDIVPAGMVNDYPSWANKTASPKLDLFLLSRCFTPSNSKLKSFLSGLLLFDSAYEAKVSLKELASSLFGPSKFIKLEI